MPNRDVSGMIMKKIALGLAISLWAGSALAAQIDVAGRWATEDKASHIVIEDCGDGTPCGKIAWFTPENPDAVDANNPDESLRTQPILGLVILKGFERKGSGWKNGTIYDPEAGKSYSSKIKLADENTLEVKGCIAFICQTQVWTRADEKLSRN